MDPEKVLKELILMLIGFIVPGFSYSFLFIFYIK